MGSVTVAGAAAIAAAAATSAMAAKTILAMNAVADRAAATRRRRTPAAGPSRVALAHAAARTRARLCIATSAIGGANVALSVVAKSIIEILHWSV